MSTEVRVRFAPSPTGYLHIGGVRTALYNWLFAKKNNGKFILRIEDTDTERSSDEFVEVIVKGLKWIGLEWDEGPIFQSQRSDLYENALQALIDNGKVYKCYCTPEELKEKREKAKEEGKNFGYDGRCRNLSIDEIKEKESEGIEPAYRIKLDREGKIGFDDIIKGRIEVDLLTLDDFVIAKRDRSPLYNFACVIDDSDLEISHVIRGDDHIYNTHKQILIYNSLEKKVPRFAHLPQVHGKDGKKLSKRTGAVSLEEYRINGYLPEALKNYLALVGWSTEDSQQIFKGNELVEKFDLSRCSSSSGIFDTEKLDWMNGKFLREMPASESTALAKPFIIEAGLMKETDEISELMIRATELENEKLERLTDIPQKIGFLVSKEIEYDEKSVNKRLKKDGVREILEDIKELLADSKDFSHESLENAVREYCEKNELGAGKIFHPLRVAVSGRMQGPGVFELLEFLGKEKVLKRIEYTLDNII